MIDVDYNEISERCYYEFRDENGFGYIGNSDKNTLLLKMFQHGFKEGTNFHSDYCNFIFNKLRKEDNKDYKLSIIIMFLMGTCAGFAINIIWSSL